MRKLSRTTGRGVLVERVALAYLAARAMRAARAARVERATRVERANAGGENDAKKSQACEDNQNQARPARANCVALMDAAFHGSLWRSGANEDEAVFYMGV